jgi:hypothetical protein
MKKLIYLFIFSLAVLLSIAVTANKGTAQMATTTVVLQTNQGDIEINLFCDIAPKTCENFIGHINNSYYNGLIFHRVIPQFMIQGGDPTGTGDQ